MKVSAITTERFVPAHMEFVRKDIIVTLDEEEAEVLCYFLGEMSIHDIRRSLPDGPKISVEEIDSVVYNLFDKLDDELNRDDE